VATDEPGPLVGRGRNADVYDIGNGRVLRRYRDARPVRLVEAEAQVMTQARAAGVPVPEVFDVTGADIVMERVAGPTMLQAIAQRPWTAGAQARQLARLHNLVHQVPAAGLPEILTGPFRGDTEPVSENDVLLHRDLHPLNVILTATGPTIIDWEGAGPGPAVVDVAMTWVIVGFSEVSGSSPAAAVTRQVQRAFTRAFLRAAGPADERWRLDALRHRLADPNVLPSEAARLERLTATGRPSRRRR
jgi:aminoglycoside phosphotransferase (APT) family kinase protein